MKRFFCDLCSTEMTYTNPALQNTAKTLHTVLVTSPNKAPIEVSLRLDVSAQILNPPAAVIDPPRGAGPGKLSTPASRTHADLCAACRWALIEQLRAGQSLAADTLLGTLADELNWGTPTE